MNLKFNNEDLELKYSFRVNVYFEQIQGHGIDFTNINSNDLITLFYCVFVATLQKEKKPVVSMIDFLDIVDENGGEKCILDFTNWYLETMKAQYGVLDIGEDDKKKPKTTGKKKTN